LAAFLEHVRRLKSWTYEFSVVVLFSILPLAIIHIPDPTANYGGFNWSQAISRGSEFEHLVHRPQQKVFDYLNVRYGNRVSVLHLRDPLTAGLDATSLVPVWYNPELARRFTAIASNDDLKKLVLDYGITHIVISQSYPITPVVRTFLNRQTDIELDNGPITLHKVDFRSWAEANLLNTSAEQNGKTLSVRLKKSRNYLLEINLPIESQLTNDYWIVFDWRNEEDEQIEVKSILENVDQVSRNLEYYVVAPEGATTVELTLPLFQDSLQHGEYQSFIALGDDKSIPHFTGN